MVSREFKADCGFKTAEIARSVLVRTGIVARVIIPTRDLG
jgi:hypothetical protein